MCESEIPLWRHVLSSWVRCSWSHVIFVTKFTTSLWPLKSKGMVHAYECMEKKNHVIPVILDEVALKLGLVLLFRYGLCLSTTYLENPRKLLCYFWWRHLQIRVSVTVQVWFMPINKSLFISDGGVYKLGLVFPFRYDWCYFWGRRLPAPTGDVSLNWPVSVYRRVQLTARQTRAREPSPPSAAAAYMRHWAGSELVQIVAFRLLGAKPLAKLILGYCQLNL